MQYILSQIFFFPIVAFSQITVYNADLVDTSKPQLYQFDQNNLIIKSKQQIDEIRFTDVSSRIEKKSTNHYVVYPKKVGVDTLTIYSRRKVIYKNVFYVEPSANPVPRVGTFIDTLLSVNQILVNPYLGVVFPGSNFRGKFYVASFVMIVQYVNGDRNDTGTGNGNLFTEGQLNTIRGLTRGDKLYFPDVRGGGPDSRIQKFAPFTIEIK